MSLDVFETIFTQFPSATPEDWKNRIIKDLKGELFEPLIFHSKENIDVLPFYTKESIQNKILSIPAKQTASWQIVERIKVNNAENANYAALTALQNGAQVIIFDLQHKEIDSDNLSVLLKDIMLDIAPVYFENYVAENKNLLISFAIDSCPETIQIPPLETLTDELVFALQKGMQTSCNKIYFHFYIGKNYFFEIARLRAFRWLWKQVNDLQQKNIEIIIRCETDLKSLNKENENNNILSNTTEAMSAILGGCDYLIINSHDILKEETSFGKRIARNVHHVLSYESYFNEIQDAAKGSYYLEYLTYHLAKNAWEKCRGL
jgi:methylmalonyl-CoA mutase